MTPARQSLHLYEAAWILQRPVRAARRMTDWSDAPLERMPGTGGRIQVSVSSVRRLVTSPLAVHQLWKLQRGLVCAPRPTSPTASPAPLVRAHSSL
ncbi:MAG TPA: hypothetical protein VH210_14900 [Gaiellaceae bacterium]|nr:hypothetical protein [Gaiellaceae bacterium]